MSDASSRVSTVEVLGYRISIGPWQLDSVGEVVRQVAPAHTIAVITDDNVGPIAAPQVLASLRHYVPQSRVIVRSIPAGEQTKTRDTWSHLTDWMLTERCGRDTTVVAVGGGVVGDVAGFVAATFMRGVPVVQVPTTLLAMVDASVGGKVGVDTPGGKNLVGAFHQPAAVIIDPTVLHSLPVEHLRAGMAEVLKHGIIADAAYLASATAAGSRWLGVTPAAVEWHGDVLLALIARSVEIKASVVAEDEREGGRRHILNFGHTVGHAIETILDYSILHGSAVAIGMVAEARLATRLGLGTSSLPDQVQQAMTAVGLPSELPGGIRAEELVDLMLGDKKARRGRLRLSLPKDVGTMAGADRGYSVEVSEDRLLESLRADLGGT